MNKNHVFLIERPYDQATLTNFAMLALVVLTGAFLRFWGLGNIGLHGDEELMGMAARSIASTGEPVLPSGMYYSRAMLQLYLMAMSIQVFGETEWALRLPSAIFGTLAIVLAYCLARRFLTVNWSIAFALVFALLPSMIALSQTARMYGFYVASVMLFAFAVFRWERTESLSAYVGAILTCLLALSFHTLTAFTMLLFFYPGLMKLSAKLLAFGAVAFAFCLGTFRLFSSWIDSQYFELVTVRPDDDSSLAGSAHSELGLIAIAAIVLLLCVVAGVSFVMARKRQCSTLQATWICFAVSCLLGATIFAALVQFHIAGLLLVIGAIFYLRSGIARHRLLAGVFLFVVIIMIVQAAAIWQSGTYGSYKDYIMTLIGEPNPWSYIIFSLFAPLAVAVYCVFALFFAIRFVRGEPLSDHFVFTLMATFLPLFLIGFFTGYLPPRYIIGFLPFFALGVFAGTRFVLQELNSRLPLKPAIAHVLVAPLLLFMFVSPKEFSHNVNPQYSDFPHLTVFRGVDHKGAAEFVKSLSLGPDDRVIAMDAQQQGYYLEERLDYYMRSLNPNRNSSFMRDGVMLNLYTGTPQIATGEQLAAVLDDPAINRVLIIGSGELESNRMRYVADGIWETMLDYDLEVVYDGRDGATKVWQYSRDNTAGARLPE